MATKKKNADRNRKKAAEKERLEKKRLGIIDVPEDDDSDEPKPIVRKDSKGKKIPTEAERKEKSRKVISFDEAKRKSNPNYKRIERIESYGKTSGGKKHKTKYVLDAAAKKWLRNAGIIAAAIIIVLVVVIVALNSAEAARKASDQVVSAEETAVSLVGMPPKGKTTVAATGKFDGFLEIEGHDIAQLYDYDITSEEAGILEGRGQDIRDGRVTYNETISTSAKLKAEEQENSEQEGTGEK